MSASIFIIVFNSLIIVDLHSVGLTHSNLKLSDINLRDNTLLSYIHYVGDGNFDIKVRIATHFQITE